MNSETTQPPAEIPTSNGLPAVAVWDYLCDPEGREWRVKRAWKNKIILTPTRHEAPDRETTRRELEAEKYIKAVVPRMLKVGQVLYNMGHRCVVDGFEQFGSMTMVLLSGEWGMGDGHLHQNAVPISALDAYAVRLPYPHELAREEAGNTRTVASAADGDQ